VVLNAAMLSMCHNTEHHLGEHGDVSSTNICQVPLSIKSQVIGHRQPQSACAASGMLLLDHCSNLAALAHPSTISKKEACSVACMEGKADPSSCNPDEVSGVSYQKLHCMSTVVCVTSGHKPNQRHQILHYRERQEGHDRKGT